MEETQLKKELDENEIVQYIIINKELNMSPGKAIAQGCHVAHITANKYRNDADYQEWFGENGEGSQTKVVKGAKQKDLERMVREGYDYIRDHGRTEIPPDSLTAVALKPMKRSEVPSWIKRFQNY